MTPSRPSFWQRFSKLGAEKPPEFLSTHPSDSRRSSDLDLLLPEAMDLYANAKEQHGSGVKVCKTRFDGSCWAHRSINLDSGNSEQFRDLLNKMIPAFPNFNREFLGESGRRFCCAATSSMISPSVYFGA